METIKIGKIYPIVNEILKRKVILYNSENKILILDSGKEIKFPKYTFYNEKPKQKINQILNCNLDENRIVELVNIIYYYDRFYSENNRLKRGSREIINEYYTYNIEYNSDIIDKIWNSQYIISKEFLPYLISIEEFLNLDEKIINKEDVDAVKILEKKLKYEGE